MNKPINYSEKFGQTLQEIDHAISTKVENDTTTPFDLGNAILFAVDYVRGEVPAIRKIAEHADVYEMLDDTFNAVLLFDSGYNGFAVVTCGWAAPIGKDDDADEIAPSQHPERRRVRLMTMVHNGKMGSSIRFTDEEAVTYDEGNAMGSLASALQDMHDVVRALKSASINNERQLP